ncbi:aryl-alcohol dehydrogenase-like predicted oxidoreductase [Sphaerotilus hippei]|uniref:Aryl-alcohol dehydrogenase-like predicted oxidoreductase n=1 Tax=Sphaerotilus hippei TaxID=744406 RepID=A0A318H9R7_9BURK|nr:aldo/keto reductase [Sphaerotilus hippei]PXW95190.1 aryl-alcohol dehydrogenase-like predicted oxidoreductase [Sphaerotilus hippei]
MTSHNSPYPSDRQPEHPPAVLARRHLLATAATLGVAPWLLSACASATSSVGAAAAPSTAGGRRRLGPLEVFPVGLGCQWRPGAAPGVVVDSYSSRFDRAAAIRLIRQAVDQGVTLIDTAEAYGPFLSEDIVGEALQGLRDQVVLETKFGFDIDQVTGQRLPGGRNSRPEHIRRVVDAQLKRLRTDHIDVLIQHRVDPNVPIEDVAGTVKDLIGAGKVRHFGMSEPGLQTVRRAHAVQPLAVIQNEYSMLWRGPEAQVLPLCEELGIGFVCWSPLGMGLLAGGVKADSRFAMAPDMDFRAISPRFASEVLPANMALADLVRTWAQRKNATPAQLSLAWLLAQKPWIVPIPGTTNAAHMSENLGAASISFTTQELQQLNAAVAAIRIQGDRLPPAVAAMSGVEAPPRP